MSQPEVLAGCAAITAIIQLSGFAAAFALQTETFYDILGGVNFIAIAGYSALTFQNEDHPWASDSRKLISTIIFCCSRGWLLVFLAWRAHDRKGDARFDGVKDKFGQFLVFWVVQGIWVMCISLPLILINSSHVWKPDPTQGDLIAITGFALGVLLEVVADIQKAVWVRAGRVGGFCQAGIWSFSRHPNYFGEMLQWWSVWALAFSSSGGWSDVLWWTSLISPLFTMHILVNIPATGLTQANGKNLKRYYDTVPEQYAEYRASTSILIPMVGYKHVPWALKRTVFLDLARFEYRPRARKSE